jgi:lipoate-protein ligase A
MVIDEVLLARSIEGAENRPTVRLYTWPEPALSVGRNLDINREVIDRCEGAGVKIVRRPSGGGAVLHDSDITYSVVAPHYGRGVLESYVWVAKCLMAGFSRLGIEAEVQQHSEKSASEACFATPTGADLAVQARKIVGSAQARRAGWFLQHGSIPMTDVRVRTAELLGIADHGDSGWVGLFIPGVTVSRIFASLIQGFEESWGPLWERDLLKDEVIEAESLLTSTISLPNPRLLV